MNWAPICALGLALSSIAAFAEDRPDPKAPGLSKRLSAELTATLPKYDPAVANRAETKVRLLREQPRNGILRLPDYIVREPRVPDQREMLTEKGRDAVAMNTYLGPSDGLDRGFLNAFTLVGAWKKIPLLNRLPIVPFGSMTNEERAREIYDREERRKQFLELMGLDAMAKQTEKTATPATTTPPK
ncbi:MAG: hypothetical protein JSR48_05005 [Verrucomicrobia bacterium]|nr:hypothetical protein [Verrucomicrobiota bacterium]